MYIDLVNCSFHWIWWFNDQNNFFVIYLVGTYCRT